MEEPTQRRNVRTPRGGPGFSSLKAGLLWRGAAPASHGGTSKMHPDQGRLATIRRGTIATLKQLNTVSCCQGEAIL